ncbi:MAG: 3-oxoacyl-[acyl-carrier-protein] reductase [Candidatus Omnitrophota bacterium]|nr:MAG: 3-oxoacyl-[acyl-carrier-protein] reductase [Candidatus Omnitrophota bacterium]RKY45119.1 MAG: 3-oxoacyl-[acyl-carrier-protein] reductase [Candidatus Omnitrophota bacterium]HDN85909.1 3-oxoacyl-[acyl-carrier-protein] reductase [Candidatus Omnitrophota bacterium]
MIDLKNKVVIVTGGSRGIGKAICLVFAQLGAKVVFTYYRSKKEADKVKQEIKKMGGKCLSIQANVRDFEQCRAVVEKTLKKFKTLDILVNNAGIIRDKALFMMTIEDWKQVIETNLIGTFNMTRSAITTFLKQKRGCIVNISSVSGLVGTPRQTNYSASKAGIIGFSKALAKEVAPYNIRVNVICPGYIATDMVTSLREDIKNNILNSIPLKRLGTPQEVAWLCAFVSSDKANYITGEVIKIDGGLAI